MMFMIYVFSFLFHVFGMLLGSSWLGLGGVVVWTPVVDWVAVGVVGY